MKVLVTRPQPEADATIASLAARGIVGIAAPLMEIVPVRAAFPGTAAALAFTSSNAVHALASLSDRRGLMGVPVFAVGDRTAAAAGAAGFGDVRSAGGDVGGLVRLIAGSLSPEAGPVVYASGRDVAGDLQGGLAAAGFEVERITVYEAVAATGLPAPARRLLAAGEIGAVLLYSPRGAEIFVELAAGSGVRLARVAAATMSEAVAGAARSAGFAEVLVAERPAEGDLFAALERFIEARRQD